MDFYGVKSNSGRWTRKARRRQETRREARVRRQVETRIRRVNMAAQAAAIIREKRKRWIQKVQYIYCWSMCYSPHILLMLSCNVSFGTLIWLVYVIYLPKASEQGKSGLNKFSVVAFMRSQTWTFVTDRTQFWNCKSWKHQKLLTKPLSKCSMN